MPVDPGNCWCLDGSARVPIIGCAGLCSRPRKMASMDPRPVVGRTGGLHADIGGMGVGGLLLMGDPEPAQPRDAAAGDPDPKSMRSCSPPVDRAGWGGQNKLLARFDGVPLVRRTVEAVLGSTVSGVTVITGHQADAVGSALAGLEVKSVH